MDTLSATFRPSLDALLRRHAKPVDKYGHQPRLYALTRLVGRNSDYDDDVVFAAAYLHDLGVFIGHRPENLELLARWNHIQYAMDHAPDVLKEVGFPVGKLPAVLDAIETHQPRDTPRSVEGVILRDSDILEQLGAIAVLRAAAKTGRDTRYKDFSSVKVFLERSLRELPDLIQLPTARALAAPRIEVLRLFLAAVEDEAFGCLF